MLKRFLSAITVLATCSAPAIANPTYHLELDGAVAVVSTSAKPGNDRAAEFYREFRAIAKEGLYGNITRLEMLGRLADRFYELSVLSYQARQRGSDSEVAFLEDQKHAIEILMNTLAGCKSDSSEVEATCLEMEL